MQREIKYRGKHIHTVPGNEHLDGTWVYGYLSDKNYINSPELEGEFLVDENTIGQYTGLMDDAGNVCDGQDSEVYENDIVTFEYEINSEIKLVKAVVKYEAGIFILSSNELSDGYIPISEIVDYDRDYFWINGVVLGNLIDNPELLQEVDK